MLSAAKAALTFTVFPSQLCQAQQRAALCQGPQQLQQEVTMNALQKPSQLLVPFLIHLSADTRLVKVPMKIKAWDMRLVSVVQRKPPLLLLPTFRWLVHVKMQTFSLTGKQDIVQY